MDTGRCGGGPVFFRCFVGTKIKQGGIIMSGVNKNCLQCNKPFIAVKSEIKRGGGQYCCVECYRKSRIGKKSSNWKGGRKTSCFIQRKPNGQFLGGVTYGR